MWISNQKKISMKCIKLDELIGTIIKENETKENTWRNERKYLKMFGEEIFNFNLTMSYCNKKYFVSEKYIF